MLGAGRCIVSQIFCGMFQNFLNENVMAKRALTLSEALRVMDAIDRRGSFAAAATMSWGGCPPRWLHHAEAGRRVGRCVLFTSSAIVLQSHQRRTYYAGTRGRVLLEAADKLTTDAEALARGWGNAFDAGHEFGTDASLFFR